MSPTNEEILEQIERLQEKSQDPDTDQEEIKEKLFDRKEELVEQNIGLVKSIANDFRNSGVDFQDLVQAGHLGLLNAAQNFDLNRGTKFSTYATHLIKGEIRHYIRDNQPVVHIPQWIQELNQKVRSVQQKIYQEKGEPPTISEIAKELNIEEEGVQEVLKARDSTNYVSIDKERRESDPRPEYLDYEKIQSKHETEFPIEYRVRIAEAIEKLTDVQQEVVKGLFYEGKTQEKVGAEIGTSQRQVSRIKYRILDEIENYFDEEPSKTSDDKE